MALAHAGNSWTEIGRKLGKHRTTVKRFFEQWKDTESLECRKGRGRKRKTSEREDRTIMIFVKRDRFSTANDVRENLPLPKLCLNTIRSRIKESGEFNSYWAAKKPFISAINRKKRLYWANARKNWSIAQWRSVMWSDESPFVLRFNSKKRVWRMHNERYSTQCTLASVKHDKRDINCRKILGYYGRCYDSKCR